MNLKGEFSILLRGEKDRRTPMKSLNEDIKTGNFKPVYLLYGEEAYLKKQYRDRITKAIFPDGDTVNYAYYEGKGINPGELIDLAETMPFFAKRRLIVVENSGFFKNATPDLADYIKTMPDTACFLFVENEADKRGKMYKAVKSKGRVVEMARQDEKTLLYWVAGNVKKEGYKIKEQTARYLLSTTGTDMENLEKELGITLFNRIKGRMQLTEAGQYLYSEIEILVRKEREINFRIDKMKHTFTGTLHIGASTTLSQYVLPETLVRFKNASPQMAISLMSGNTAQIEQEIVTGNLMSLL